jgi:hypothetical protein
MNKLRLMLLMPDAISRLAETFAANLTGLVINPAGGAISSVSVKVTNTATGRITQWMRCP